MQDYNMRKSKNQELITYISDKLSEKVVKRMVDCNSWIQFVSTEDGEKRKIQLSNNCGNRFCPICTWRKARKDALKIDVCMKHIDAEYGSRYIFGSLTCVNPIGDKLTDTIKQMNEAWRKMFKRKELIAMNKGYVRKLEVTYNAEQDTYHPHFHFLMVVNPSYFKSRDYLKQEKWLSIWRECMQDERINQVWVKPLYAKDGSSATQEVSKYTAKPSDYMYDKGVFDYFYGALKGRQLITFNGRFKEAVKLFKQGKLDKYLEVDSTEYMKRLLYIWGYGEYVEWENRSLTEEEREEVNKQLIKESDIEE